MCFPFPQIEGGVFLKLNLVVFCASGVLVTSCLLQYETQASFIMPGVSLAHVPCSSPSRTLRTPGRRLFKPLVAFLYMFDLLIHTLTFFSLSVPSQCPQLLSSVLQCPTCLSQCHLHKWNKPPASGPTCQILVRQMPLCVPIVSWVSFGEWASHMAVIP